MVILFTPVTLVILATLVTLVLWKLFALLVEEINTLIKPVSQEPSRVTVEEP